MSPPDVKENEIEVSIVSLKPRQERKQDLSPKDLPWSNLHYVNEQKTKNKMIIEHARMASKVKTKQQNKNKSMLKSYSRSHIQSSTFMGNQNESCDLSILQERLNVDSPRVAASKSKTNILS